MPTNRSKIRKNKEKLITVSVLFGILIILMIVIYYQIFVKENPKNYDATTIGKIIKFSVTYARSYNYDYVYEYQVEGKTYTGTSRSDAHGGKNVGKYLIIRYKKDNPEFQIAITKQYLFNDFGHST